jgi:TPR repeat protein
MGALPVNPPEPAQPQPSRSYYGAGCPGRRLSHVAFVRSLAGMGNGALDRCHEVAGGDDRSKGVFGNVDAEIAVADWYLYGMNWHPKSSKLAARWYLRAAKRGDTRSQFTIGEMFEFGECVRPDHEKALAWIRKALVGAPSSSMSIARRYQTGFNAPRDPQKAIDWYLMSAEAGGCCCSDRAGRDV